MDNKIRVFFSILTLFKNHYYCSVGDLNYYFTFMIYSCIYNIVIKMKKGTENSPWHCIYLFFKPIGNVYLYEFILTLLK